MLLASITAVVLGLAALIWAADRFVMGASATARGAGISPLIIGLVIIGFGTSAPEMLVATLASLQGNPALGIGNAIGSNIANIALIIGVAALIRPLTSSSTILRRELPLLFAATLLAIVLMLDGGLGHFEGVLLLTALAVAIYLLARQARAAPAPDDPLATALPGQIPPTMPLRTALVWTGVGLVVLLLGSRALVWGAVNIAHALGVSELIIGLTVVAIGTSLPELSTAIASAIRREHDLLLGNVIGSNLFNTLAVLGLPALLHPSTLDAEVLTRDVPVMALLSLAFIAMLMHRPGQRGRINRLEATLLLLSFGGYLSWLFATL